MQSIRRVPELRRQTSLSVEILAISAIKSEALVPSLRNLLKRQSRGVSVKPTIYKLSFNSVIVRMLQCPLFLQTPLSLYQLMIELSDQAPKRNQSLHFLSQR